MRLLIVHNDYGRRSGEEIAVDQMAEMMEKAGVEVTQLRLSSQPYRNSFWGQAKGFIEGIYSINGVKRMQQAINDFKPDVINIHNLYPFISPASLRVCRKANIPVLMTVHNYRLICPNGLMFRNNSPCRECLKNNNEWSCLLHNCEGSMVKSLGYALRNAVSRIRRDYLDCVSVFVCITEFQRRQLLEAKYDSSKIHVIPHSIKIPVGSVHKSSQNGYVAYCGRISREKGVDILIKAAEKLPNIEFRLAGVIREDYECSRVPSNVRLVGYLTGEALKDFYINSDIVVMPSRCYEGLPMALLEAASYGKPVIGPAHGAFVDTIGSDTDAIGMLFKPGDPESLAEAISNMYNSKNIEVMGNRGFLKIATCHSPEIICKQWMNLLSEVVS